MFYVKKAFKGIVRPFELGGETRRLKFFFILAAVNGFMLLSWDFIIKITK